MSTIVIRQSASAQVANAATDNFVTVTLPNPTQTGSLLVAIGVDDQPLDASEIATPFSDNGGHTWQIAVPINDGQYATANRITQRFVPNIIGRSGHSFTYTSTGIYFPSIAVVELGGGFSASPLDQVTSNTGHSPNLNPRSTGVTAQTLAPNEIAVAGFTHGAGFNNTFASNNGFTIQTSQTNTTNRAIVLSTKTFDNFATAEDAFNLTPNTATDWAALIATYIAAPMATVIYGLTNG